MMKQRDSDSKLSFPTIICYYVAFVNKRLSQTQDDENSVLVKSQ